MRPRDSVVRTAAGMPWMPAEPPDSPHDLTCLPQPEPCVIADSGRFQDMYGQISCLICDEGTYSNIGQANCTYCPGGRYNSDEASTAERHSGVTSCKKCASGEFSTPKRTRCLSCSAGEYISAAQSCESCDPGKYTPLPINGDCLSCGGGQYTGVASAATTCTACSAGMFAPALSVNCSVVSNIN